MEFSEKFLYHIWDAQHLTQKLQTISGKAIKVLFPGRWNTDAGPDFKDAIIEIDGEVIRGDVELEISTYNWHLHEHDENPDFNSVILHVVYTHNGKYDCTISENGAKIEILTIADKLDEDVSKLIKKFSSIEPKETSLECRYFDQTDLEKIETDLLKLGLERFEAKGNRFKAEHYFADFDQLLWQGLLEALGYSKNKYQMLQVALHIKYNLLQNYYLKGMSENEMLALLLGASNLLSHLPERFPKEIKLKWQELYTKFSNDLKPLEIEWKLFRLRPVNHPAQRILQISSIIYKSLETSLFHQSLKLFSTPETEFKIKEFRKRLYQFFQLKNEIIPENMTLGKTRIDTILINIILPLVMVYSREKKFEQLENTVKRVYQSYSGLPGNFITDHMERFMNDQQKKLCRKRAIFQQGILKLYYDNCRYQACDDCLKS